MVYILIGKFEMNCSRRTSRLSSGMHPKISESSTFHSTYPIYSDHFQKAKIVFGESLIAIFYLHIFLRVIFALCIKLAQKVSISIIKINMIDGTKFFFNTKKFLKTRFYLDRLRRRPNEYKTAIDTQKKNIISFLGMIKF